MFFLLHVLKLDEIIEYNIFNHLINYLILMRSTFYLCIIFKMKTFLIGVFALLSTAVIADDCPESKQISCVDDVRAAY
jgi:hypothetical protein